jgi:hypothetical protein
MSALEQFSFLTLAEREYSFGKASNTGGKLSATGLKFIAGKDMEDAKDELKEAAALPSPICVQASIPFAIIPLKASDLASKDSVIAAAQKASGFAAADLRVSLISAKNPHVAAFSKSAISARSAEVGALGVQNFKLFPRGVNAAGALQNGIVGGKIDKPVLYVDIIPASARVMVVSAEGVEDIGLADTGTEAILELVMAALGLKFPGSAARLFYGDLYDFDEHAEKLVAALAEKIKGKLSTSHVPAPGYIYASGFPASRVALLSGKLGAALSLNAVPAFLSIEGDSTIPTYFAGASLGLAGLIASGASGVWTIDLASPEEDLSGVLSRLSANAARPAPIAPKPVTAPAKSVETLKPEVQAAHPANGNGHAAFNAKPVQPAQHIPSLRQPVKKVEPPLVKKTEASPARPVAKAPQPVQKPVQPQKISDSAQKVAPDSSSPAKKNNNVVIIGGVVAAVVVLAVVAFIVMGGKKEAPAPAPAPVKEAAKAPEKPVTQPAVEKPAQLAAPAAQPQGTPTTTAVTPVAAAGTQAQPTAPATPVVEEPAPPPPPPPPTTGSVSIQTNPVDAEIYINGELKGRSPLILDEIPVGQCAVEIRKANYRSITKNVEIIGGEIQNINDVTLVMERGSLAITTSPDGIPYVIKPASEGAGADDPSIMQGKTPVDLSGLKPGNYKVIFQRPGWKAYETSVEIKPAQISRASFNYKPGKIHVASTPDGADVIIGGRKAGVTPLDLDNLAEGIYDVAVKLDAYEPESLKLDVPFGGSVSSEFKLLKLDRVITNAVELDVLPSHSGGMSVAIPANLIGSSTGSVNVMVVIGTDGKVEFAKAIPVNGYSEDANDYISGEVLQWTFVPGSRKGFPMRVQTVVTVNVTKR